jgi:hypothetical protein
MNDDPKAAAVLQGPKSRRVAIKEFLDFSNSTTTEYNITAGSLQFIEILCY